jgi:hypothetical protein
MTTPAFMFLVVLVGQIYAHTTPINSSFDPLIVSSWATIICIRGLSASIITRVVSIYREMLYSMSPFLSFASLHSTAGAKYHFDVLLLPPPEHRDNNLTNTTNEPTLSMLPIFDPPMQLQ